MSEDEEKEWLLIIGKQPVGISSQDRLMSTSYRYEVNKGKPDQSALRLQQTAQVSFEKLIEPNPRKFLGKLERRTLFHATKTIEKVTIFPCSVFSMANEWNSRDKYEQFKAQWVEQSAWSNIALREASVNRERGQELILLRKAHLTVPLIRFSLFERFHENSFLGTSSSIGYIITEWTTNVWRRIWSNWSSTL